MDEKMINLAIGKLSDDVQNLKTEVKELKTQLSILKTKKQETVLDHAHHFQSNDELLDLMQVRKVLNVSRNTVLMMVKQGTLRAVRINQRTIRYSRAEVQELIKRQ